MLDEVREDSRKYRPTWDDIELTLKIQIDDYIERCNAAALHPKKVFVSTEKDIQGIFAKVGNKRMENLIHNIIAELISIDASDIFFRLFIGRLKNKVVVYQKELE
jgi:hypothetical protein